MTENKAHGDPQKYADSATRINQKIAAAFGDIPASPGEGLQQAQVFATLAVWAEIRRANNEWMDGR